MIDESDPRLKHLYLGEAGSIQAMSIGQIFINENGLPSNEEVQGIVASVGKQVEYWIWRLAGYNKLFEAVGAGGLVAEIGVHFGDNASRILRRAKPKELHLVDPWRRSEEEKHQGSWFDSRLPKSKMEERYSFVRRRFAENGNVRVFREFSEDWFGRQEDEKYDWVYIDGDHVKESVLKDLQSAMRVVKCGGIISGDDYEQEGWWRWGVRDAVDQFISENREKLDVLYLREPFILRKLSAL